MNPNYYIGSKPLSFYGFGDNYIKKSKDNTFTYLNQKNDFEIVKPMTTDERRRYIAYNLETNLKPEAIKKYQRSLFNPVLVDGISPLQPINQASVIETTNLLAPFSAIINEWMKKRGTANNIISVDAQRRIFVLETVDEFKQRNNIKNDIDAINILKSVTIPNKPGFYLFYSNTEQPQDILNKMPQLTQVNRNNIPLDSILSQPVTIQSQVPAQQQQSAVASDKVLITQVQPLQAQAVQPAQQVELKPEDKPAEGRQGALIGDEYEEFINYKPVINTTGKKTGRINKKHFVNNALYPLFEKYNQKYPTDYDYVLGQENFYKKFQTMTKGWDNAKMKKYIENFQKAVMNDNQGTIKQNFDDILDN